MKQTLKLSALLMAMLVALGVGCDKPAAPEATTTPEAASTPDAEPTETMAEQFKVEMTLIDQDGLGNSIGFVEISESRDGLVFTPDLTGLPPGSHGFHVHQNPDCGASMKDGQMTAGNAAGPHYDPTDSGKHAGPEGEGHAGDLPSLFVTDDGNATAAVTAPRLKVADVTNRSLMIHADSDDYAASPGGARIACGVVR